jgi:heterodisulfide reductase subunit C
VAEATGTTPNRFLRLLQLGLIDEALESHLLWMCVGCSTCGARCPNLISTNEVIDQLRVQALGHKGIAPETGSVRTFHRLFLNQIRRFGRLHEASLIGSLKMRTRTFFKDLGLGLKMFKKGKLPLIPHKIRGIPEVKSIYRRRKGRQ